MNEPCALTDPVRIAMRAKNANLRQERWTFRVDDPLSARGRKAMGCNPHAKASCEDCQTVRFDDFEKQRTWNRKVGRNGSGRG